MIRTLRYRTAAWQRWLAGLPRASAPRPEVERAVAAILRAVRRQGDTALVRYTARFDRVRLTPRQLRVPAAEIRALARRADVRLVAALRDMARQIEAYHRRQKHDGFRMRLRDGSRLEEVVQPLASVGLYVPGGAGAYPSSVLMNAIPARVAGVPRIAVVTPPRTLESNPSVAAALVIAGLVAAGLPAAANVASTRRALRRHAAVVLVRDLVEGVRAVNALAPEHAEVMTRHPEAVARQIVAGAVFVGPYAPVAVGDYGVGPNHVLPTGGSARFSSPL